MALRQMEEKHMKMVRKEEFQKTKDSQKRFAIFFTIAAILWMIIIFLFSAQPAEQSTDISHRAGELVGIVFVPGFKQWEPERQQSFAAQIDFGVRKTAHAMEYAFLCALILLAFHFYVRTRYSRAVSVFRWRFRNRITEMCLGVSVLVAVAYAVTDEVHQLFVPGRSGRITDVLIDGAGAVVGGIVVRLLMRLHKE